MGRHMRAEAQRWAGFVGHGRQTELLEMTPRPQGRSLRTLGHLLRRLVPFCALVLPGPLSGTGLRSAVTRASSAVAAPPRPA